MGFWKDVGSTFLGGLLVLVMSSCLQRAKPRSVGAPILAALITICRVSYRGGSRIGSSLMLPAVFISLFTVAALTGLAMGKEVPITFAPWIFAAAGMVVWGVILFAVIVPINRSFDYQTR